MILIIGNSNYHGLRYDLPGVRNDVESWQQILAALGRDDVVTVENVTAAYLKYYFAQGPEAIIYSGHGAQVRTSQGYYEALVCLARCGGFSYFLDREVMKLLDAGVNILCDSCHAGGMDDGFNPGTRAYYEGLDDRRVRSLGPRDLNKHPEEIITGYERAAQPGVMVAATKRHQYAYEFTAANIPRPGGLFSQTIAEVLEEEGRTSLSWVDRVVERVVNRSNGKQIPEAEALDEFFNRL